MFRAKLYDGMLSTEKGDATYHTPYNMSGLGEIYRLHANDHDMLLETDQKDLSVLQAFLSLKKKLTVKVIE